MNATIIQKQLPIAGHYADDEIQREFIYVDCQQEDLPKLRPLVLEFEGRKFTFSGWNSDSKKAYFVHFMDCAISKTATII